MGSRSHPRFVLCVCVCVCVWAGVCGCVWLRLIRSSWESSPWAILDPVTLSPLSDPCSVCRVRVGDSVRSCSWFRDSWALLLSSLTVYFCNKPSIFRNWILPSSLWQKDLTNLHGFSGDSWFAGTVSRQQRSYGSPGGEYVEHRTSCAGVSSAGVRAHNPGTIIKITRCATHTAELFHPREQQPLART